MEKGTLDYSKIHSVAELLAAREAESRHMWQELFLEMAPEGLSDRTVQAKFKRIVRDLASTGEVGYWTVDLMMEFRAALIDQRPISPYALRQLESRKSHQYSRFSRS